MRPWISRFRLILIGWAAGLMLGLGIALLREYFDHSVYTAEELAARCRVPVLSSVRKAGPLQRRRLLKATG